VEPLGRRPSPGTCRERPHLLTLMPRRTKINLSSRHSHPSPQSREALSIANCELKEMEGGGQHVIRIFAT
jgi:hypothetical protein